MNFQIIKSNKTETGIHYAWRLLSDDGRVLARSKKYKTLEACKKDVHYVALSAVSVSLDYLLADGSFSLDNLFSSGIVSSPDTLTDPVFTESSLTDPVFTESALDSPDLNPAL